MSANPPRKYRFGFILTTTIGNRTHYLNLRRFAEADHEVESWWVPVDHKTTPAADRLLRFLPRPIAMRVWIFHQLLPAFRFLGRSDAVMIHQFEAEIVCAARSYLASRPLLVSSTDEAPAGSDESYPVYPGQGRKSATRKAFRLSLDRWRAHRFALVIPFTKWAAALFRQNCDVADEKIVPIHVGIDLGLWTRPESEAPASPRRRKILFVGTDFERKGGDLLLAVFKERFADVAELHMVTGNPPDDAPPNVHFHRDMSPNDPRLVALYAACDMLVMPTGADLAPWAFIEAMAMRRPTIGTDVGAISEIIDDGVTGFVIPVGDAEALGNRMQRLLEDDDLAREMGRRGRLKVERDYDAARNVPKILAAMKAIVDRRRSADT